MRFLRLVARVVRAALILLVVLGLGLWGWAEATRPNLDTLPKLQDGDLVFQTIRSHQTTAIMLASHTWLSHVGIVRIGLDGTPRVVEAVGPVREIPLDRWIKQGVGGRLLIKRLPDLTRAQARAVLAAAERYSGKPYDFFFLPDDDRTVYLQSHDNGRQCAICMTPPTTANACFKEDNCYRALTAWGRAPPHPA